MNVYQRVYLDYAATAPLLPQVREAMLPYLGQHFGNASALYAEGKEARKALEQARDTLAAILNVSPLELTFCSGGTEAAATLCGGMARALAAARSGARHLICSAFEHHAVLDNCLALRRQGFEVSLLRPRRDGRIHPDDLSALLRKDTLLVAVMWVQNELGTVQPLAELSHVAHQHGACFFTDAVQGLGKLPVELATWQVDAAAFSAHKIGGPQGVGLFYLRQGTPFMPSLLGGGQESKRRSGTQNVAGAMGFAKAAEQLAPSILEREAQRLAILRDETLAKALALSPRVRATVDIQPGDIYCHLPGLLHLLMRDIESQTLVLALDESGIAASGGAACSSGSLKPSHVVTSLGIASDLAHGALRISMGSGSCPQDCELLITALAKILARYYGKNAEAPNRQATRAKKSCRS
ncbi:MAG: cysteine desulfurase [Coriobacteriales bacterium]|jgi:cysteine desulfurase|nr:cysteine desulfurase [Coriobacteriales bacterium]